MKSIKYQLATEIDRGTAEAPDIEIVTVQKEILCEDAALDANLALARAEAHNGEVTVEEIPATAEEVRARRDRLLEETDKYAVLDAPIDAESRTRMYAYRQALRDIPEQAGFPEDVAWPELPAVTKAEPDPVDAAFDELIGGESNA